MKRDAEPKGEIYLKKERRNSLFSSTSFHLSPSSIMWVYVWLSIFKSLRKYQSHKWVRAKWERWRGLSGACKILFHFTQTHRRRRGSFSSSQIKFPLDPLSCFIIAICCSLARIPHLHAMRCAVFYCLLMMKWSNTKRTNFYLKKPVFARANY